MCLTLDYDYMCSEIDFTQEKVIALLAMLKIEVQVIQSNLMQSLGNPEAIKPK